MLETEYFMNGFHGESFLEEVSVPSNKVVSVCHWRFTLAVLVTFCENTVSDFFKFDFAKYGKLVQKTIFLLLWQIHYQ